MRVDQILFASAITASACAAPAYGQTTTTNRIADEPELAGLAERWTKAIDQMGVPGFAVAVVKDGKVLALDAFGVRDPDNHPVTPQTMFYIASATKPFNAMALCALVDEGKVDLDKPVKTYLPQFTLADADAAAKLTVRDLLCHRPGINSEAIVHRDAYTGEIDDETYFRLLAKVTPTGQVEYSNVHFTLAGRVIEAVSGQKWQDFLAERILKPAGMPRTTAYASKMYGDADCATPIIPLVRDSEGKWMPTPLVKTDRTMHAAGGLGTCAADAARWLLLNLGGGEIDGTRIISPEMSKQTLEFQSKHPQPQGKIRVEEGFGLGWQRGKFRGREPYYNHGGGYVGASSYFCFLPQQNIGVAVLVNCAGPGGGMCDIVSIDILDRLLGVTDAEDLLPSYIDRTKQMKGNPNFPRPSAANIASTRDGLTLDAAKYVGTFANLDFGHHVVELNANGELVIRAGDLRGELLAAAEPKPNAFRAFIAAGMISQGRFVLNDKGDQVVAVALSLSDDGETLFKRQD